MPSPIKVISGNSMRVSLTGLVPQFERASGLSVTVSYDPAQVVLKRIESGETADLAIRGEPALDQLIQQGKVKKSTRRPLVSSPAGVGTRAGAPRPDISSAAAFKTMLLNARAIAYASEGASGIHFMRVVEQMGIADEIKAKSKTRPGGVLGELLVSGEADIAIQHIPELKAAQGIQVLGTVPPGFEFANTLVAGIVAASEQPAAAQTFLDFLMSPDATTVLVSQGLKPLF
jgi:molybdate transport system substrate-binding protein